MDLSTELTWGLGFGVQGVGVKGLRFWRVRAWSLRFRTAWFLCIESLSTCRFAFFKVRKNYKTLGPKPSAKAEPETKVLCKERGSFQTLNLRALAGFGLGFRVLGF